MNLCESFVQSKNLGVLAGEWLSHLQKEMAAIGISTTARTVADEAASLVAPAALIAAVATKYLPQAPQNLRVLVLGRDPMFRLDGGRWLSYAKALIGNVTTLETLTLIDEDAKTSLHSVALGLGLNASVLTTQAEVENDTCGRIDFAIWVHPVNEIDDELSRSHVQLAAHLVKSGVPVFGCHFNEVDHIAQTVMASTHGLEFKLEEASPGELSYVNKFGIALTGTGVRGGWGAIISRLARTVTTHAAEDVLAVRLAFALMRIEGGGQSGWTLGDSLASIASGPSRVIGLLANMAIDLKYGRVFDLDPDGKELKVIGHLWDSALNSRPDELAKLIVWAARIYLCFTYELPPGDKDMESFIKVLQAGMDAGIHEAGIGLARCYESSRRPAFRLEADRLYRLYADQSPLAAYYLGHEAFDRGDQELAAQHFTRAADAGYPHAICDLAIMSSSSGAHDQALKLWKEAARRGDVAAIYQVAAKLVERDEYDAAKESLKVAIEIGDAECAQFFLKIVEAQIKSRRGDRVRYKREQSWVRGQMKHIAGHAQRA